MVRRIGVEALSGVPSGPANIGTPAGMLHIAGLCERGPVDEPAQVSNFAQYVTLLGGRAAYASHTFDTARTFFEEGGADLLVSRVVGPGATRAQVQIGPSDGEPVIEVQATDPGGWANDLSVLIESGGSSGVYTVQLVDGSGAILAAWRNVVSASQLASRASAFPGLRVRSLAPDAEVLSLETGEHELTGGSDDRDNVTTQAIITALDAAGEAGEGGAVAVPGYTADIIGYELTNYAERTGKIALLAGDRDASIGEMESLAAELISTLDHGEYAGLFHPHVVVPDGTATRTVSPEGTVAGRRAAAFADGQFWRVPAGIERGRTRYIAGTVAALNGDDIDRLDIAQVNGIQTRGGRVYLKNWATLAEDRQVWPVLANRDLMNNIMAQVERALEPLVWEEIDGRGILLSQAESAIVAIVGPIAEANGLYPQIVDGEEIDPGYLVNVNSTNNTAETAAQDRLVADLSVRPNRNAKLIQFTVTKVAVGAAL